ncbi:MAG: tetratricopeptide repeat protein, partial [Rhodospirillales bacterium]|nr:tetratricopeptide repeat protein [Rhodospirillales bacterium]
MQDNPDQPVALHLLGVIAHQEGRHNAAVDLITKALAIKPDYLEAHNNLGTAFEGLGKMDKAVDSYRKALAIKPDYAKGHNNLGNAFTGLGRQDEAVASYNEALAIQPDDAETHINLGNALKELGKLDDALASYQKALAIQPDYAEGHNNFGNALKELGRLDEAVASYQKALAINPDSAEAHNNLGNALHKLGKLDEAIANYHKALAIKPDYAEAHINLELAFRDQGNVVGAAGQIDLALSYNPENAGLLIRKALLLPVIPFSQEEILALRETLDKAIQALLNKNLTLENPAVEVGLTNFYLAYHNQNDRKIQEGIARLFIAACPSLTYEAKHCRPEQREEREGGKEKNIFRIGILSSFLFDHSIGKLTRGIIQHLSRDKFKVIIFRPPGKKDHISEIIDRTADKVVSLCCRLETDQHTIEDEELDILFYPDIGMSPYNYFLAFARLAPIQVVTWGHPVTTGIPNIDYFLSSELLEVSGASEHYSEQLITLRNVPTYYFRPEPPKKKFVREDYGLPPGVRLYVCPQALFKFHPQFDTVLGDLLRRDPEGRLVLIDDGNGGNWKRLIYERFNHAFPDVVDHVIFVPQMPLEKFFGFLTLADALLDIPTFSGGNSSFEALAMGVPIATWPQEFMRGRVTAALYKQMGLNNLIATDTESYLKLALR